MTGTEIIPQKIICRAVSLEQTPGGIVYYHGEDSGLMLTQNHLMKTFEELGLDNDLCRAVDELGFTGAMPVQEAVIPFLIGRHDLEESTQENDNADSEVSLSEATDLVALAQTGTGKTAAYGLPLLQTIDCSVRTTQALILSPTRELCLQIADDLTAFGKYKQGLGVVAVYGGTSIQNQIHALKHGAQIIVATPGRLIDLMHRGVARLETVSSIVLDEADEMLNMGFSDSINEIFESLPEDRRTLLFSATMSKEVEQVAKNYLHNHREIVVGSRNEGAENVNHIYYLVNAKDKYLALKRIADYNPKIFAIIFCRTKIETQDIADKLIRDGYNAESLHGDLSQQQRDLTMQKFRQHLTQLLVATDVAARGLDVDDLTHVINYSLPDDTESYTHRSGRTGRAGKKGTSISIIHTRERHKVRQIEKIIGKEFVEADIPTPEEICKKQLYKVMDQIVKTDVNDDEIAPFMDDINRYFEFIDKDDLIMKIVSREFGRFLAYYANAPKIEKPSVKGKGEKGDSKRQADRQRGPRKAEKGFVRLFINLGKNDGFYPGEVMQLLNRTVKGRQQVGHIDLMSTISYIEVPEKDAKKVMEALDGIRYHGREVRCNPADEGRQDGGNRRGGGRGDGDQRGRRDGKKKGYDDAPQKGRRGGGRDFDDRSQKGKRGAARNGNGKSDDWKQFFKHDTEFRGPEPDFSEEGWARRRPKKK